MVFVLRGGEIASVVSFHLEGAGKENGGMGETERMAGSGNRERGEPHQARGRETRSQERMAKEGGWDSR